MENATSFSARYWSIKPMFRFKRMQVQAGDRFGGVDHGRQDAWEMVH